MWKIKYFYGGKHLSVNVKPTILNKESAVNWCEVYFVDLCSCTPCIECCQSGLLKKSIRWSAVWPEGQ